MVQEEMSNRDKILLISTLVIGFIFLVYNLIKEDISEEKRVEQLKESLLPFCLSQNYSGVYARSYGFDVREFKCVKYVGQYGFEKTGIYSEPINVTEVLGEVAINE